MKKVCINALNEFIAERLKFTWELNLVDIFDSSTVDKQVLSIVNLLPQDFWEKDWSITIQDSANVRKLIKEDLSSLTDNSKLGNPWNEDLQLPIGDE